MRKSIEEVVVVVGSREEWLERCRQALERQGFTKVEVAQTLGQIHANYKKMTTWGTLDITLLPEGDAQTRMNLKATANVDNVYAVFRSPGKKILETFKTGLE